MQYLVEEKNVDCSTYRNLCFFPSSGPLIQGETHQLENCPPSSGRCSKSGVEALRDGVEKRERLCCLFSMEKLNLFVLLLSQSCPKVVRRLPLLAIESLPKQ